MSDVLEKILAVKREEVAAAKRGRPLAMVRAEAERAGKPRDFTGALRTKIAAGFPAVIAEIKKASPSKGVLRPEFDPAAIARSGSSGRFGIPVIAAVSLCRKSRMKKDCEPNAPECFSASKGSGCFHRWFDASFR